MRRVEDARSVSELIDALAGSGKKPECLFFWGHTPKVRSRLDTSCFSQWYPARFEHQGAVYPTAEHFMMAQKALLFSDTECCEQILVAKSPAAAKSLGRKVRGFNEDSWQKARFDIVVKANVAKFGSTPELQQYLLQTGNKVLVEASPVDKVWGIGLDAESARNLNPRHWRGLNLLGFALMEARSRLSRMR